MACEHCGLIPVSPEMGGVCEACEQQVDLLARGVCLDCIDSLKEAAALTGQLIVEMRQTIANQGEQIDRLQTAIARVTQ